MKTWNIPDLNDKEPLREYIGHSTARRAKGGGEGINEWRYESPNNQKLAAHISLVGMGAQLADYDSLIERLESDGLPIGDSLRLCRDKLLTSFIAEDEAGAWNEITALHHALLKDQIYRTQNKLRPFVEGRKGGQPAGSAATKAKSEQRKENMRKTVEDCLKHPLTANDSDGQIARKVIKAGLHKLGDSEIKEPQIIKLVKIIRGEFNTKETG
jgi:hypothetical protein